MKKIILLGLALATLLFTGCSDMLDTDLTGSTVTQEEYDNLDAAVSYHILGVYSQIYVRMDDDSHAAFGQKSIDISTDLMSADMALTGATYGWFSTEAQLLNSNLASGSTAMYWSHFYTIIKNCNLVLANLEQEEFYTEDFLGNDLWDDVSTAEAEAAGTAAKEAAGNFAQILTMRAYAYYELLSLYGVNGDFTQPTACIYTEQSIDKVSAPLSTGEEVYLQIKNDLELALKYFEHSSLSRSSKLAVDENIAYGLQAYNELNYAFSATGADNEHLQLAYSSARKVIDTGVYPLLQLADLTTTGFVSVDSPNWMWGNDVNKETTGGLASFFGQMDIYTYSYAYAGDVKAIDDALFATIPATDGRKAWWSEDHKLAPTGKFFDVMGKKTTKIVKGKLQHVIDRDWVNDDVYMRIEEMYLIAAEAAARMGKDTEAVASLQPLMEQRDTTVAATLSGMDNTALMAEIAYNWRVEMWGEGRALQAHKRFGINMSRGTNHYYLASQNKAWSEDAFYFATPSGEISSNPNISY